MRKWLAGLIGAVITGSVLWILTNALFPRLFNEPEVPVAQVIAIECIPTPGTVAPGETSEILVRVTMNGNPVEGAAVYLSQEDAANPARTVSGGTYRFVWRAPNPAAAIYEFPAYTDLAGIRTAEGDLSGTAATNCQVLVR